MGAAGETKDGTSQRRAIASARHASYAGQKRGRGRMSAAGEAKDGTSRRRAIASARHGSYAGQKRGRGRKRW